MKLSDYMCDGLNFLTKERRDLPSRAGSPQLVKNNEVYRDFQEIRERRWIKKKTESSSLSSCLLLANTTEHKDLKEKQKLILQQIV